MVNAYHKAGVNVDAGYEVVERIKKHVQKTERLGVMGALGGFGGCFDLSVIDVKEPVLVSGTDGVGTKLLLAIQADKHETIGIDCVAMCVNDVVAQGAQPLFFLDYIATGKTIPERLEKVVAGVAEGCRQAGAALIGGETAEMPGLYGESDYDLAGFVVGVAEKQQLITGQRIQAGDVLIGLPSSGIHSNGYSLVRKLFFQDLGLALDAQLEGLQQPLVDELLTPTRIYVDSVMPLVESGLINGVAHVTGGGFIENLPRMLKEDLAIEIHEGSWPILPIFRIMEEQGKIARSEMYEIFNMGIGMVLAVAAENVTDVQKQLAALNEECYQIGYVKDKVDTAIVILSEDRS